MSSNVMECPSGDFNGLVVGVLAVQGGYHRHGMMLKRLGASVRWVKKTSDLSGCHGLILPGGESTTMTLMLREYGLMKPLREFAGKHPVMGTCAGAIMMSRNTGDVRVEPLDIMDITVERNAYGSQLESFIVPVKSPFANDTTPVRAIFIRAPRIRAETADVDVLMEYDGYPVMVRQNRMVALAFHPELTEDTRLHAYFLRIVRTVV